MIRGKPNMNFCETIFSTDFSGFNSNFFFQMIFKDEKNNLIFFFKKIKTMKLETEYESDEINRKICELANISNNKRNKKIHWHSAVSEKMDSKFRNNHTAIAAINGEC